MQVDSDREAGDSECASAAGSPEGRVVELFALWCLGDAEAMEALLDLEGVWLNRLLFRRVRGVLRKYGNVEDYRQELKLRLLESGPPGHLENHRQLRGYVETVARNMFAGKLRAAGTAKRSLDQEQLGVDASLLCEHVVAEQTGISTALDRAQGAAWLHEALRRLPEDHRDLVVGRVWEGQPFAQLGEDFGLSEDAARMRFQRVLVRLAAEVKTVRGSAGASDRQG